MKLGVFGSRSLHDERVKMLILDEIDKCGADTIVTTQEPLGVCTVAQNVAKFEHYILELHFLNFRYRSGAYEHRTDAVIASADRLLLIHDGHSRGTANELKRVKKSGKPYRYEVLDVDRDQRGMDPKLESFVALKSDNANMEDVNFDLGISWTPEQFGEG